MWIYLKCCTSVMWRHEEKFQISTEHRWREIWNSPHLSNSKFLHMRDVDKSEISPHHVHFFLPTFCFESTICVTYFNIHLLLFTLFNFLGEQSIFFRYTMGPGGYEVECTACGSRLQVKGKGNLCRFVAIYAVLSRKLFCRDLRAFVAKIVLSRFTHFCVEKNWTQNYICGEKMTNIRYGVDGNE